MATSTGKTVALVLLVLIIILLAWRITPLMIAPFGIFTGMVKTFRTGIEGIHVWPCSFRISGLSFVSLILFILWIVVIVWVYRDAERRGMNGVLWALLVLIGNLIGLIIYLIVRTDTAAAPPASRESPPLKLCPGCQKPVGQDFVFCPHCGARLQMECPKCRRPIETDWNVCPHCGEKLKKK